MANSVYNPNNLTFDPNHGPMSTATFTLDAKDPITDQPVQTQTYKRLWDNAYWRDPSKTGDQNTQAGWYNRDGDGNWHIAPNAVPQQDFSPTQVHGVTTYKRNADGAVWLHPRFKEGIGAQGWYDPTTMKPVGAQAGWMSSLANGIGNTYNSLVKSTGDDMEAFKDQFLNGRDDKAGPNELGDALPVNPTLANMGKINGHQIMGTPNPYAAPTTIGNGHPVSSNRAMAAPAMSNDGVLTRGAAGIFNSTVGGLAQDALGAGNALWGQATGDRVQQKLGQLQIASPAFSDLSSDKAKAILDSEDANKEAQQAQVTMGMYQAQGKLVHDPATGKLVATTPEALQAVQDFVTKSQKVGALKSAAEQALAGTQAQQEYLQGAGSLAGGIAQMGAQMALMLGTGGVGTAAEAAEEAASTGAKAASALRGVDGMATEASSLATKVGSKSLLEQYGPQGLVKALQTESPASLASRAGWTNTALKARGTQAMARLGQGAAMGAPGMATDFTHELGQGEGAGTAALNQLRNLPKNALTMAIMNGEGLAQDMKGQVAKLGNSMGADLGADTVKGALTNAALRTGTLATANTLADWVSSGFSSHALDQLPAHIKGLLAMELHSNLAGIGGTKDFTSQAADQNASLEDHAAKLEERGSNYNELAQQSQDLLAEHNAQIAALKENLKGIRNPEDRANTQLEIDRLQAQADQHSQFINDNADWQKDKDEMVSKIKDQTAETAKKYQAIKGRPLANAKDGIMGPRRAKPAPAAPAEAEAPASEAPGETKPPPPAAPAAQEEAPAQTEAAEAPKRGIQRNEELDSLYDSPRVQHEDDEEPFQRVRPSQPPPPVGGAGAGEVESKRALTSEEPGEGPVQGAIPVGGEQQDPSTALLQAQARLHALKPGSPEYLDLQDRINQAREFLQQQKALRSPQESGDAPQANGTPDEATAAKNQRLAPKGDPRTVQDILNPRAKAQDTLPQEQALIDQQNTNLAQKVKDPADPNGKEMTTKAQLMKGRVDQDLLRLQATRASLTDPEDIQKYDARIANATAARDAIHAGRAENVDQAGQVQAIHDRMFPPPDKASQTIEQVMDHPAIQRTNLGATIFGMGTTLDNKHHEFRERLAAEKIFSYGKNGLLDPNSPEGKTYLEEQKKTGKFGNRLVQGTPAADLYEEMTKGGDKQAKVIDNLKKAFAKDWKTGRYKNAKLLEQVLDGEAVPKFASEGSDPTKYTDLAESSAKDKAAFGMLNKAKDLKANGGPHMTWDQALQQAHALGMKDTKGNLAQVFPDYGPAKEHLAGLLRPLAGRMDDLQANGDYHLTQAAQGLQNQAALSEHYLPRLAQARVASPERVQSGLTEAQKLREQADAMLKAREDRRKDPADLNGMDAHLKNSIDDWRDEVMDPYTRQGRQLMDANGLRAKGAAVWSGDGRVYRTGEGNRIPMKKNASNRSVPSASPMANEEDVTNIQQRMDLSPQQRQDLWAQDHEAGVGFGARAQRTSVVSQAGGGRGGFDPQPNPDGTPLTEDQIKAQQQQRFAQEGDLTPGKAFDWRLNDKGEPTPVPRPRFYTPGEIRAGEGGALHDGAVLEKHYDLEDYKSKLGLALKAAGNYEPVPDPTPFAKPGNSDYIEEGGNHVPEVPHDETAEASNARETQEKARAEQETLARRGTQQPAELDPDRRQAIVGQVRRRGALGMNIGLDRVMDLIHQHGALQTEGEAANGTQAGASTALTPEEFTAIKDLYEPPQRLNFEDSDFAAQAPRIQRTGRKNLSGPLMDAGAVEQDARDGDASEAAAQGKTGQANTTAMDSGDQFDHTRNPERADEANYQTLNDRLRTRQEASEALGKLLDAGVLKPSDFSTPPSDKDYEKVTRGQKDAEVTEGGATFTQTQSKNVSYVHKNTDFRNNVKAVLDEIEGVNPRLAQRLRQQVDETRDLSTDGTGLTTDTRYDDGTPRGRWVPNPASVEAEPTYDWQKAQTELPDEGDPDFDRHKDALISTPEVRASMQRMMTSRQLDAFQSQVENDSSIPQDQKDHIQSILEQASKEAANEGDRALHEHLLAEHGSYFKPIKAPYSSEGFEDGSQEGPLSTRKSDLSSKIMRPDLKRGDLEALVNPNHEHHEQALDEFRNGPQTSRNYFDHQDALDHASAGDTPHTHLTGEETPEETFQALHGPTDGRTVDPAEESLAQARKIMQGLGERTEDQVDAWRRGTPEERRLAFQWDANMRTLQDVTGDDPTGDTFKTISRFAKTLDPKLFAQLNIKAGNLDKVGDYDFGSNTMGLHRAFLDMSQKGNASGATAGFFHELGHWATTFLDPGLRSRIVAAHQEHLAEQVAQDPLLHAIFGEGSPVSLGAAGENGGLPGRNIYLTAADIAKLKQRVWDANTTDMLRPGLSEAMRFPATSDIMGNLVTPLSAKERASGSHDGFEGRLSFENLAAQNQKAMRFYRFTNPDEYFSELFSDFAMNASGLGTHGERFNDLAGDYAQNGGPGDMLTAIKLHDALSQTSPQAKRRQLVMDALNILHNGTQMPRNPQPLTTDSPAHAIADYPSGFDQGKPTGDELNRIRDEIAGGIQDRMQRGIQAVGHWADQPIGWFVDHLSADARTPFSREFSHIVQEDDAKSLALRNLAEAHAEPVRQAINDAFRADWAPETGRRVQDAVTETLRNRSRQGGDTHLPKGADEDAIKRFNSQDGIASETDGSGNNHSRTREFQVTLDGKKFYAAVGKDGKVLQDGQAIHTDASKQVRDYIEAGAKGNSTLIPPEVKAAIDKWQPKRLEIEAQNKEFIKSLPGVDPDMAGRTLIDNYLRHAYATGQDATTLDRHTDSDDSVTNLSQLQQRSYRDYATANRVGGLLPAFRNPMDDYLLGHRQLNRIMDIRRFFGNAEEAGMASYGYRESNPDFQRLALGPEGSKAMDRLGFPQNPGDNPAQPMPQKDLWIHPSLQPLFNSMYGGGLSDGPFSKPFKWAMMANNLLAPAKLTASGYHLGMVSSLNTIEATRSAMATFSRLMKGGMSAGDAFDHAKQGLLGQVFVGGALKEGQKYRQAFLEHGSKSPQQLNDTGNLSEPNQQQAGVKMTDLDRAVLNMMQHGNYSAMQNASRQRGERDLLAQAFSDMTHGSPVTGAFRTLGRGYTGGMERVSDALMNGAVANIKTGNIVLDLKRYLTGRYGTEDGWYGQFTHDLYDSHKGLDLSDVSPGLRSRLGEDTISQAENFSRNQVRDRAGVRQNLNDQFVRAGRKLKNASPEDQEEFQNTQQRVFDHLDAIGDTPYQSTPVGEYARNAMGHADRVFGMVNYRRFMMDPKVRDLANVWNMSTGWRFGTVGLIGKALDQGLNQVPGVGNAYKYAKTQMGGTGLQDNVEGRNSLGFLAVHGAAQALLTGVLGMAGIHQYQNWNSKKKDANGRLVDEQGTLEHVRTMAEDTLYPTFSDRLNPNSLQNRFGIAYSSELAGLLHPAQWTKDHLVGNSPFLGLSHDMITGTDEMGNKIGNAHNLPIPSAWADKVNDWMDDPNNASILTGAARRALQAPQELYPISLTRGQSLLRQGEAPGAVLASSAGFRQVSDKYGVGQTNAAQIAKANAIHNASAYSGEGRDFDDQELQQNKQELVARALNERNPSILDQLAHHGLSESAVKSMKKQLFTRDQNTVMDSQGNENYDQSDKVTPHAYLDRMVMKNPRLDDTMRVLEAAQPSTRARLLEELDRYDPNGYFGHNRLDQSIKNKTDANAKVGQRYQERLKNIDPRSKP